MSAVSPLPKESISPAEIISEAKRKAALALAEKQQRTPHKKGSRKHSGSIRNRAKLWVCKLKHKRINLLLTLKDITNATQLSHSTLISIERGCDPKLSTAQTLCIFFNCKVEDLWEKKDLG